MDFYTSKPKLLLMQTFFILMTVLFLTTFRTTIGVLLSLFFIFLVVKTLPDLFVSVPVLRFDHNGIQTNNKRNNRFGLILWTDIVEIRITSFKLNRFLAIEVKNPEEYRARVIADKGALLAPLFQDPSPYISLSFDLLSPSLNKAVEYIKSNHPDKLANEVAKK
jgi:hypothetical protein